MGRIFVRTVPNVMEHFGCSAESAHRFIDLREEGYSFEAAALMAGLSDPPEPDETNRSPLMADSEKVSSLPLERERFEEWADEALGYHMTRSGNEYVSHSVTCAWQAWQVASAGRQELLDALREIAEMMSYSPDHGLEALAECKCIARAAIAKATGEQQ